VQLTDHALAAVLATVRADEFAPPLRFDHCLFARNGMSGLRTVMPVNISHSRFEDNRGFPLAGGALSLSGGDHHLRNVTFVGNRACQGGAIALATAGFQYTPPIRFFNNGAEEYSPTSRSVPSSRAGPLPGNWTIRATVRPPTSALTLRTQAIRRPLHPTSAQPSPLCR
jgi:predicted outer membrane repeat protein